MEDLNLVIPLIDLIKTNNQNDIFWAYNNYAKQFQRIGFLFKEEDKGYYGRYFNSKEYDKILHKFYVKQNDFLGFKILSEETLLYELFEGSEDVINDGTGFKIGLFSAKFQIATLKNNFDLGNYIEGITRYFDRIEKCNFDEKNFCPDSKELDLVAKYFLGIIEPENLFDFLKSHLSEYKGDCYDFLKHTIELTSEIWNNSTPKNLERKIKFKEWINYVVYRFELDKTKLGLTSTNSEQTDLMKNRNPTASASVEESKQNFTFDDLFPSVEDKKMVMKMLVGLKIVNSEGKYLLGNRTGMIRVFIDVMKEEGYFVGIDRKPILRVFTPKILGKTIEVIKEPSDFETKKRQILKKLSELRK